MAKNFNSAALPEHCYAVLPSSGQLIEVRRGEKGYYPCAYSTGDREYNKVLANQFNAHEGISKAQAEAMLAGSMFGWNVPAADPARYDAEGIPIQPGEKKAPTRSPEYQYEQAKLIRQHYQPGSKVVLDENMEDPYCEMPAGLTGIVDSVDDLGQIHCHWENGSSLALIPGVDHMQRAFSSELKPRARLVLQVLVLHCNKEGECFPSIKTIAAKCGYGVSTVKRALDELVKAGYIVKQARFDERKNGGQTSNLYTLCSDLLCPDKPENAPVLEDDASDESPAVQPESAPADACNASDPTPGEQSATLPTADSYSFADGFETKIGRQFCRPIRMWTGGQSIFIPP